MEESKINGIKCANVNEYAAKNIHRINGSNYIVNVFFSQEKKQTVQSKLERLIRNEVLKKN